MQRWPPASFVKLIRLGVVKMSRHGRKANTRRPFTIALSAAVILVAGPTASAQIDAYRAGLFVPVVKVRFEPRDNPSFAEKRQNEVLNLAIAAFPQLAIPAPRFSLVAAGADPFVSAAALDCMTAAIYYEAANEPITGQRAVAQVVLNRVRHPAFPNTICGVVFQGSERTTGCQFTFTCDGSLLRRPSLVLWNRARTIAAESLGGFVETSVGHATHYHASYVLPYWAPKLTKLTSIGSHIFYQWKGGWSDPSAYTARYAGNENLPLTARNILEGYLFSSVPNSGEAAQLVAAQTVGRANLDATDSPSKGTPPATKSAGMGEQSHPVTNLNVARSELIETRARLKDRAAPVLATSQGTLSD